MFHIETDLELIHKSFQKWSSIGRISQGGPIYESIIKIRFAIENTQ